MSDDALLWTHKPAPRCRSRPGEQLCSIRKENVTWSCELRFHGESVGWEAQILRDGELSIARAFVLRDLAMGWAKNEQDRDDPSTPRVCPARCLALYENDTNDDVSVDDTRPSVG
jgi:hypothetical protein